MRTEGELRALLVLLGDDDERVVAAAKEALVAAGEAALPLLEEASRAADPRLRGRTRLVLGEMRLRADDREWAEYAAEPDAAMDLERGWLLLSRLHGADMDERAIHSFLDAIGGMVRAHMVSVGGLQALGEVLFDNLGFRGGQFENPESHYLPTVLEHRAGIPIALATLYVLVGRRVGLPVSGVAMPGHYLARYDRPHGPVFVDCYNRGHLYQYETLSDLLQSRGAGMSDRYLAPCSHRFTLYRMLNNLERVYDDKQELRLVERVRQYRAALGLTEEE